MAAEIISTSDPHREESDPGEITPEEEVNLFAAVVAGEMAAAADVTSVNSAVEKLNNEYTSDAQAKVTFNASERRREEIRDGRGETSKQESEGYHG